MGDAKRRKQLGLMPEVENREVTIDRDGRVEGDVLPPAVLERLTTWAETGARWDARYRTTYIGTGMPRELLNTAEELTAIPVPTRMRLRLGLLSGSAQWLAQQQEQSPESFFDDGGRQRQLNIRATEYDLNGRWVELPAFDPDDGLRYLMQHPAVTAAPQGSEYTVTVWHGGDQDGQAQVEPEPPAEHREALLQAAHVFLGESDEEWLQDHHSNLHGLPNETPETESEPGAEEAPVARRLTLWLSPVPPVLAPNVQVLGRSGDMDVAYFQSREAYTHDGQTWHDYPRVQDNRDQLRALLEGMGMGDLSDLAGLLSQAGAADEEREAALRTIDAEPLGQDAAATDTPG